MKELSMRINYKDQLTDALQTALCKELCADHCKASRGNDSCYCTEAGLVAVDVVCKMANLSTPPSPISTSGIDAARAAQKEIEDYIEKVNSGNSPQRESSELPEGRAEMPDRPE